MVFLKSQKAILNHSCFPLGCSPTFHYSLSDGQAALSPERGLYHVCLSPGHALVPHLEYKEHQADHRHRWGRHGAMGPSWHQTHVHVTHVSNLRRRAPAGPGTRSSTASSWTILSTAYKTVHVQVQWLFGSFVNLLWIQVIWTLPGILFQLVLRSCPGKARRVFALQKGGLYGEGRY